jgi:hypothetical protein
VIVRLAICTATSVAMTGEETSAEMPMPCAIGNTASTTPGPTAASSGVAIAVWTTSVPTCVHRSIEANNSVAATRSGTRARVIAACSR